MEITSVFNGPATECVTHRLSSYKPIEGTVRGVVHHKEIGYTEQKTSQNEVSQDTTVENIDTCLIQTT